MFEILSFINAVKLLILVAKVHFLTITETYITQHNYCYDLRSLIFKSCLYIYHLFIDHNIFWFYEFS